MVTESKIDSWRLFQYETVTSTMDEALSYLKSAEPFAESGVIFQADTQQAGRGRYDRVWRSPPGNLYASLAFAISGAQLPSAAQLSFVGSLSLADALLRFLHPSLKPQLKWPNDVLLNGKKIAGFLLESHTFTHRPDPFIIMGMGVNIISSPQDVRYPASSLKEEVSLAPSPQEVFATFLAYFDRHLTLWHSEGFDEIRRRWLDYAFLLNQKVAFTSPSDSQTRIEGLFLGVDPTGQLLLKNTEGETLSYWAGDLFPGLQK